MSIVDYLERFIYHKLKNYQQRRKNLNKENPLSIDEFARNILGGLDEYEPDLASSFSEELLKYEVAPYENLKFARMELSEIKNEHNDITHHCINCVNQLKRAVDGMMNIFLDRLGLMKIIGGANLHFEQKMNFLVEIGAVRSHTATALNRLRNNVEHDFSRPDPTLIDNYYENAWFIVKDLKLQLQVMHIFNEIEFFVGDKRAIIGCRKDIHGFSWEIDRRKGTVVYDYETTKDEYVKTFKLYWKIVELYSFYDIDEFKNGVLAMNFNN